MEPEQLFLEPGTGACMQQKRSMPGGKLQPITIGACMWKHNVVLPGKQRIQQPTLPLLAMFRLEIGYWILSAFSGNVSAL